MSKKPDILFSLSEYYNLRYSKEVDNAELSMADFYKLLLSVSRIIYSVKYQMEAQARPYLLLRLGFEEDTLLYAPTKKQFCLHTGRIYENRMRKYLGLYVENLLDHTIQVQAGWLAGPRYWRFILAYYLACPEAENPFFTLPLAEIKARLSTFNDFYAYLTPQQRRALAKKGVECKLRYPMPFFSAQQAKSAPPSPCTIWHKSHPYFGIEVYNPTLWKQEHISHILAYIEEPEKRKSLFQDVYRFNLAEKGVVVPFDPVPAIPYNFEAIAELGKVVLQGFKHHRRDFKKEKNFLDRAYQCFGMYELCFTFLDLEPALKSQMSDMPKKLFPIAPKGYLRFRRCTKWRNEPSAYEMETCSYKKWQYMPDRPNFFFIEHPYNAPNYAFYRHQLFYLLEPKPSDSAEDQVYKRKARKLLMELLYIEKTHDDTIKKEGYHYAVPEEWLAQGCSG